MSLAHGEAVKWSWVIGCYKKKQNKTLQIAFSFKLKNNCGTILISMYFS